MHLQPIFKGNPFWKGQEAVSERLFARGLCLPSGTAIDLTLDTTLNANELAGDLMELNRSRNGEVSTPRTEPDPEPEAAVPTEPAAETP